MMAKSLASLWGYVPFALPGYPQLLCSVPKPHQSYSGLRYNNTYQRCCLDSIPVLCMMGKITQTGGRLLALGLSAFLIYQIIMSVKKLQSDRTAVSVRKYYEDIRLMPSVSICFLKKRVKYPFEENNSTLAELELNLTR